MLDLGRVEFDNTVTTTAIQRLAENSRIRVLQCSSPVTDHVWNSLNSHFFASRPDVQLRVYGHYSTECDLTFARRMTNVRRFAADSLIRARNVEAIAEIPALESLSLGVFELDGFHVLDLIAPTLTELTLGATKSRKLTIAALERFHGLRTLYLEGQSKGIEVLGSLRQLEDVTLRSITTPDLGFLTPLRNLWSLDIKLGGIRSFAGIEDAVNIKYLEVWQVRELKQVDFITRLPGLQNLFLQSLPHLEELPRSRICMHCGVSFFRISKACAILLRSS